MHSSRRMSGGTIPARGGWRHLARPRRSPAVGIPAHRRASVLLGIGAARLRELPSPRAPRRILGRPARPRTGGSRGLRPPSPRGLLRDEASAPRRGGADHRLRGPGLSRRGGADRAGHRRSLELRRGGPPLRRPRPRRSRRACTRCWPRGPRGTSGCRFATRGTGGYRPGSRGCAARFLGEVAPQRETPLYESQERTQ